MNPFLCPLSRLRLAKPFAPWRCVSPPAGSDDQFRSAARDLLFFSSSSLAPRRERQAAPGGTAVFCFGFASLRVLVPPIHGRPPRKPTLALGAAIPRVRPG